MIRRSPTRIELKLDDIQEFDYVQKYDKKKTAANADNGNLSATSTSKLLRHERIGLHRPGTGPGGRGLCMSSVCTSSSGNDTSSTTTTTTQIQQQPQQPSSSVGTTTTTTGVTSTSTPANVDREGRSVSVEGQDNNNTEGTGNNNNNNTSTTAPNNDGNNETPESTLDTLPSDIDTPETNDMDLLDFNSTYASANMSMDET